ncbi:hypothetical protein EV121DRAFT_269925 [Schizophyllum commune]
MSKSIDCLGVYDILLQICVELQNQHSLHSLAAVAAVNRAISSTALDVLWETQGSWVPLLRTLEEHRLVSGSDRKELTIADPIRRASWSRMQTYAARIKVLHAQYSDSGDRSVAIPDATVRTLLIRSGGRRIIPDLREYQSSWRECPSDIGSFPFLFIGPSLKDLCFYIDGSPHDAAIFATLPSLCPNLTALTVYLKSASTDIRVPTQDLSDTACQWKSESLRSVTLPIGSLSVVQQFGTSPQSSNDGEVIQDQLQLLAQRNDATLAMRIEMVLLLFDIVNSDTIRSISCVQGGLRHVQLPLLPPTVIKAGANIRNIRSLRLECWIDLTDDDLTTLAGAWPCLENFNLDADTKRTDAPSASVLAFIPFLRYCPNLAAWSAYVDARSPPPLSSVPTDIPPHCPVKLYFSTSPIEEPQLLAAFLLAILPEAVIETHLWPPDEYRAKWIEVTKYAQLYNDVRAHEHHDLGIKLYDEARLLARGCGGGGQHI